MEAGMHMDRFVVLQVEDEWLVTYGDRTQIAFATRKEAETSAFAAADAMASNGHAVSVLIMPDRPDAEPEPHAILAGRTPRASLN
jgi:hypothetical protein